MDKTIAKGLRVLETLAHQETPMAVSEVATVCDLTRSNAHRTLAILGYVEQKPISCRYKLALKIWSLGASLIARLDIKEVATIFLCELNEVTGETTHLSVRDGHEILYIDKLEAKHAVRTFTRVGGRAPAFCVATGKAMLAFQNEVVVEQACNAIVTFTPQTTSDPIMLREELYFTRVRGYAINRGEWRGEAYGLAVPIRDVEGKVNAAIGISAPCDRLTR
jgi:DNA-binding IclR family transcriptional regulator